VFYFIFFLLGEKTIYGMKGFGVVGIEGQRKENKDKLVAVTSASHATEQLDKQIKLVNPDVLLREGGCGYKCLLVCQNVADVYLYPQMGTKKWDTCAPEAILNELGGIVTDSLGKPLEYPKSGDMKNSSVIACINKEVHSNVIKKLALNKI